MTDFSSFVRQGASGTWLFIRGAILPAAPHGFEAGHSRMVVPGALAAPG